MRVRMVPEGTVWGAGECLGGADGHGVPGALLGHSMAFRGALAGEPHHGMRLAEVSPPHCVRFLARHRAPHGLAVGESKEWYGSMA